MALAERRQSRLRSSPPTLVTSPANGAGCPHGGDAVNWLWLNIPLMSAFFATMTGIPLWLVFKHPDNGHIRPAPVYLPSNRDRYAQVGR
jgi:hypothetical protein